MFEQLTAAPPDPILAATRAASGGAGVLYMYGNYAGDVMNFDMAVEMAAMEEIEVRTVLTTDDVASAPPERREGRRGVAGNFFIFKAAGAACDGAAGVACAGAAGTATRRIAAESGSPHERHRSASGSTSSPHPGQFICRRCYRPARPAATVTSRAAPASTTTIRPSPATGIWTRAMVQLSVSSVS